MTTLSGGPPSGRSRSFVVLGEAEQAMNEQLAVYLNDHLAGARFAIELLERLHDANSGQSLGLFANQLLIKIDEDRAVLQGIADRLGDGGSTLKQAAAWMTEKLSRLKLRLESDSKLGVFETLETLSLGILGKRALWRLLSELSATNSFLKEINFQELISRAESQHGEVEAYWLSAGRAALTNA
jgi:hypothetical protein